MNMSNKIEFKIDLDTKKLEQQLRRQQEEAEKELVAKSIVEKQPMCGDMRMLDKTSEEVLKILLAKYENNNSKNYILGVTPDIFPEIYRSGFPQIFENLKQYGVIFDYKNPIGCFIVTLSPSAFTYFEDKEKALKREHEKQNIPNINIGTFNATGSNINFGTISDSTLYLDIERQIEENGGNDTEELKILLKKVKELCDEIQANKSLPERSDLMQKISNHMSKHGWLYNPIAQLILNAVMTVIKG